MSDDDDDDVPEVASFFSKRAKFVPKLSTEEFQAASKLLEEINEGREKCPLIGDTESVPAGKRTNPARKRGKKKASVEDQPVEKDISTVDDNAQKAASKPALPLSAAAKRRLRKVQMQCMKELRIEEEANKKVLSSLHTPSLNYVEDDFVDNCDIEGHLAVSYFSEVSRIKYSENEKFSTIFPRVADLYKLKVSEFLLCLRDKNIKVDDTPKSLNIVASDILECIPYKPEGETETNHDVDSVKLLFQASDQKGKIEIFVHKLEKMQDTMEKYSKIRNIPLDQMVFEFDGEQISGTETPNDMDMESGNCVDVRILNADDKVSRKAPNKSKATVFDLTAESDSTDSDIIFCY